MDKFWGLLEKSTLISGFIAVVVIGGVVCMAIVGQEIPELLGNAALIIVGFFFGSKSAATGIQMKRK